MSKIIENDTTSDLLYDVWTNLNAKYIEAFSADSDSSIGSQNHKQPPFVYLFLYSLYLFHRWSIMEDMNHMALLLLLFYNVRIRIYSL